MQQGPIAMRGYAPQGPDNVMSMTPRAGSNYGGQIGADVRLKQYDDMAIRMRHGLNSSSLYGAGSMPHGHTSPLTSTGTAHHISSCPSSASEAPAQGYIGMDDSAPGDEFRGFDGNAPCAPDDFLCLDTTEDTFDGAFLEMQDILS